MCGSSRHSRERKRVFCGKSRSSSDDDTASPTESLSPIKSPVWAALRFLSDPEILVLLRVTVSTPSWYEALCWPMIVV